MSIRTGWEMDGRLVTVLTMVLLAYTNDVVGRCWSNVGGKIYRRKRKVAFEDMLFSISFFLVTESKPHHKLSEVFAELNDGSPTLRCAVDSNSPPLQQGQRLVWREGGSEVLSDEHSSVTGMGQLLPSRTSSQVTLTNFSWPQYGQYTCQCENYQYTVEEMREVIDADGIDFQYYCSEARSITVPANGEHF